VIVLDIVIGLVVAVVAVVLFSRFRRRRQASRPRTKRVLVPFTDGELEPTVLEAAIRVSQAEDATMVPAYLIVTPFEYSLDAPMHQQVDLAMPLLEAVENAAGRAGVPVDARVESGRSPTHALRRLWEVERFHRIVAPAPVRRGAGFTPKELQWILAHAPSETLILRPDPTQQNGSGSAAAKV
jgi:hypothetical protein